MADPQDEFSVEQARIARQEDIAKALMNKGGYFRRNDANEMFGKVDQDRAALAKRYQEGLAAEVDRIGKMRQGREAIPAPADELGGGPGAPAQPGDARGSIQAALLSRYTPVRDYGKLEHATYEREQSKVGDREARSADREMVVEAAKASQAAGREATAARATESADLRRELAAQADATRREIARAADAQRQQKNTPKLPTPALKLQQEELDAIGTSSSINADLGGIAKQIDDGKLDLSLYSNVTGAARNIIGISDENSRNLASFKSTLEKLRNDSLRLNKGVQTEGDSQRAWNELVANINDKGVVKQRIAEIRKINERAVNLRKMNVDSIRGNFGLEPLDTGGYEKQPAAVGTPTKPRIVDW